MSTQFRQYAVDGFPLTGMDDFGCLWTVEATQGWYTGGAVRTDPQARMQQHGDWRGKGLRGGRIITARGKVQCPDPTAMELASRRLSAVLADGGFGEFVGDSPAGVLTSKVQLDDLPLFDPLSAWTASWQITVGSEDRLLYGPATFTQTSLAAAAAGSGRTWPRLWTRDWGVVAGADPGTAFAPNAGTAAYWPRLRITTGVDATNPVIRVAETGDSMVFNGTIPAGQFIDIDTSTRAVTYGAGADDVRHVTDMFGRLGVPIGGATYSLDADAGDESTVLEVYGWEGAWT